MTDLITIPELTVITTARDLDLPEGVLPAGSGYDRYGVYRQRHGVEFDSPWDVPVTVIREDIILSDDDELCRLAAEEFANGTYEQREAMIEMVRQAHLSIRADLVAEHGEEMVDLMGKLPEIIEYDNMAESGQRIVDGGMTVAGQFLRGLSKADLSAWIRDRFVVR